MTQEFRVITACGTEKDGFDTYAEAETGSDTHAELCDKCGDGGNAVIEPVEDGEPQHDKAQNASADGGPNVVDEPPQEVPPEVHEQQQAPVEQVPEESPTVDTDPVSWMPDHFIDDIQGTPTVNRKGYAVIAAQYGVSVEAEPVTLPSETGFDYAEFKATATTEDGETYTGFGSAHVDRQDGDDPHLLGELAETRAMKRATAWATGVGMTAASELMNEL